MAGEAKRRRSCVVAGGSDWGVTGRRSGPNARKQRRARELFAFALAQGPWAALSKLCFDTQPEAFMPGLDAK